MGKGIRVTADNIFSKTVKVVDNETGKEIPDIAELKLHCLPEKAVMVEMKIFPRGGFDITVLPENVNIIIEEVK